jgi:LemA protein
MARAKSRAKTASRWQNPRPAFGLSGARLAPSVRNAAIAPGGIAPGGIGLSNWIIILVVVACVLYAVAIYNRLVTQRNRVRNAWSQIDVQLRRRHDLVPNLVESVKGYMAHERGVIDAIVDARKQAMAAGPDVAARADAENALGRSLRSLFALVEAIPQLRASENVASLQEELGSTENRIAFARQHYNDSVMQYNTAIETVPSNVVAGIFAFKPEALYTIEETERQPVAVKF